MNFEFKHIYPNFLKSYQQSISIHGANHFVSVYTFRGEVISKKFSEFGDDVQKVQTFLQKQFQLRPFNQVVTIAANQYEHLVYIVAVWVLGIPHCPINPNETPKRIDEKIALLGQESLCIALPSVVESLRSLDRSLNIISMDLSAIENDSSRMGSIPTNNDPMELIFTSGSTGYAKIVEQSEKNILSNVDCLIEHHSLGPGTVVCTPLPVFHVNALHFSFLSCLLSGAKLVLLENILFPQLWQIIEKESVNILSVVPQIIKHLVEEPLPSQTSMIKSLRYIVTAAAPLSHTLANRFYKKFGLKIIQGFGLSEAVNFSCVVPIDITNEDYADFFLHSKLPSIGCALQCNQVLILDSQDKEITQPEKEGELALCGINLMGGYRHEISKITNENRIFRTGDLGYFRFSSMGKKYFYISGRIKDIIKRGGLSISLQELDDAVGEFILKDLDIITVGFENDYSGEDIGLVMSFNQSKNQISIEELRKKISTFINHKLPSYMRPSLALLIAEPVRSASGKPLRGSFSFYFKDFKSIHLGRSLKILDLR